MLVCIVGQEQDRRSHANMLVLRLLLCRFVTPYPFLVDKVLPCFLRLLIAIGNLVGLHHNSEVGKVGCNEKETLELNKTKKSRSKQIKPDRKRKKQR